jgi:hypothetical protein
MFRAGIIFFFLYLLYIAWMEGRLLVGSCAGCYYYGKRCAFGKGRIACLVTKQKESGAFSNTQVTWKSIIPDLLVTLVPMVTAVVLMIINFSWVMLVLAVILVILTSAGNAWVRGKLACKYCAQRELGCPAERLFDTKKAEQKS